MDAFTTARYAVLAYGILVLASGTLGYVTAQREVRIGTLAAASPMYLQRTRSFFAGIVTSIIFVVLFSLSWIIDPRIALGIAMVVLALQFIAFTTLVIRRQRFFPAGIIVVLSLLTLVFVVPAVLLR